MDDNSIPSETAMQESPIEEVLMAGLQAEALDLEIVGLGQTRSTPDLGSSLFDRISPISPTTISPLQTSQSNSVGPLMEQRALFDNFMQEYGLVPVVSSVGAEAEAATESGSISSKSRKRKQVNSTNDGQSRKRSKTNKTMPPRPKMGSKDTFNPAIGNIRNIMSSNVFADATSAFAASSQPSHGQATGRRDALRTLIDNVPDQDKAQARRDKTMFDQACKEIGPGQISVGDGSQWKVKGMISTLKPHQVLGLAFMLQRERSADPPGGIMADTMGLGKTVMSLALMAHRSNRGAVGPTLIVVPAALQRQWKDEIDRHCETGDKSTVHSVLILRQSYLKGNSDPIVHVQNHHVIITTYEQVVMSYPDQDPPPDITDPDDRDSWWIEHLEKYKGVLHRVDFHRIILDEAHMIRNPESKRFKAIKALKSKYKWCLTATPFVNGPQDVHTLFNFIGLNTGYTYERFKRSFSGTPDTDDAIKLGRFLDKIMIHRTHADRLFSAKLVTLPGVKYECLKVNFNAIEQAIYQVVKARFRNRMNHLLAEEENVLVATRCCLVMITRLRQLCAHPLILSSTVFELLEKEDYVELNKILTREKTRVNQHGKLLLAHIQKVLNDRSDRLANSSHDSVSRTKNVIETLSEEHLDGTHSQGDQDLGNRHGTNPSAPRYTDMFNKLETRTEEYIAAQKARFDCVVCHQNAKDPYITSCNHVYCHGCLQEIQDDAAIDGLAGAMCVGKNCLQLFGTAIPLDGQVLAEYLVETNKKLKKSRKAAGGGLGTLRELTGIDGAPMGSAKTIACKSAILNWLREDPSCKIIIFTVWRPMLLILESMCKTEKWQCLLFHGAMSAEARDATIKEFSQDPDQRVLLSSLQAGGVGLNLTAASRVICVDPWYVLHSCTS